MTKEPYYPTVDKIIEFNALALSLIEVKKADRAQVLSISRINEVIRECKEKRIKDNPKYAKIMLGIRERYYSDSEIREWIKNGEIREFKR